MTDHEADLPEDQEPTGGPSDEFWYALADLLRRQEFVDAANKWVDASVKSKPAEILFKRLSLWLAYGFASLVFVGIAVLAWLRVINSEVTAGLLGSLIGYWFGQRLRAG